MESKKKRRKQLKLIQHTNLIFPLRKKYNNHYLYKGVFQSLKEKRNIILIHTPLAFDIEHGIEDKMLIRLLHYSCNIPLRTLSLYHIFDNAVNTKLYLQPKDFINMLRYPKRLFSHQPFILNMIDNKNDSYHPQNFSTTGYNLWDAHFVYLINQLMYTLNNFPYINRNGLDIIIQNILKVPAMPYFAKYLRNAPQARTRFLFGGDHSLQFYYSFYDGFGGNIDPISKADGTIFEFSRDLNLINANRLYDHRPLANIKDYW